MGEVKRPRMSRGLHRIAGQLLRRLAATNSTTAATTSTAAFARTFVELLASAAGILVLALVLRGPATGLAAAAGILPLVQGTALRLRRTRAVARGERNLEFVEFIPLGVGAVAVRYGQQFLHARPRGYGGILWRL
jgi:hypothetical protein